MSALSMWAAAYAITNLLLHAQPQPCAPKLMRSISWVESRHSPSRCPPLAAVVFTK